MLYSYQQIKIFILIFIFISLWYNLNCQIEFSIIDENVPSSQYEQLKQVLTPILDHINASAQEVLETDDEYIIDDSLDFEGLAESIPEDTHSNKNVSSTKSKYRQIRHNKNRFQQDNINRNSKSLRKVDKSDPSSGKYGRKATESIKDYKSSEKKTKYNDFDLNNFDILDTDYPLQPNSELDANNLNIFSPNVVKTLAEKLRHGKKSQDMDSLYEKYKAELDPFMEKFNFTSLPPSRHNDTLELNLKKRKPENSDQSNKYTSLYEQFKKRLIDFSTELDVDAGLTDGRQSTDMIADVKDSKSMLHDTGNLLKKRGDAHVVGDHITAEFMKVQNIVDRIEREPSKINGNKKRYDSIELAKKDQVHLSKAISHDLDGNNHRFDADRQTISNGGYVNNDYSYEDNYRPLPILRRPEVPFKQRNRQLRGVQNPGSNYLTWSPSKGGTDGSVYNTFFPNVYSEPITQDMEHLSARGYLERIAQKLNISTLDVAKKVAGIRGLDLSTLKNDPELHKLLQDYVENSVISAAKSVETTRVSNTIEPVPVQPFNFLPIPTTNISEAKKENPTGTTAAKLPIFSEISKKGLHLSDSDGTIPNPKMPNLPKKEKPAKIESPRNPLQEVSNFESAQIEIPRLSYTPPFTLKEENIQLAEHMPKILEKLLTKIQEIQSEKSHEHSCNYYEDIPCKLGGSWLSKAMGLRFDIALNEVPKFQPQFQSQSQIHEGKTQPLTVSIHECIPPRKHDVFDTDWPIAGSALRGNGGPFFLYTQKQSENILATFVGYCRNCGGTDTIYGTWSFSFPSKSCQDSPASFQTKNDVMRRYKLKQKRLDQDQQDFRYKSRPWWKRF